MNAESLIGKFRKVNFNQFSEEDFKKNFMVGNWDALKCDYFYEVCVNELGSYFSQLGYISRQTDSGAALFEQDKIIGIHFSYLIESAPNYELLMGIKLREKKLLRSTEYFTLPFWSLQPMAKQKEVIWKFSNRNELTSLLRKVQSNLIDPYVAPLLADKVELMKKAREFKARWEAGDFIQT